MRVAVIGSGISGLSAAWLLSDVHDVTVYETGSAVGLSKLNSEFNTFSIDVPIRVFSQLYHKNLYRFYRHLGLEMERADISVCFCSARGDTRARFQKILPGNSPLYVPTRLSADGLHFSRAAFARGVGEGLPSVLGFLFQVVKSAFQDVSGLSFGEWLRVHKLATDGYYQYLAPALMLTFSCTHETLETFSAEAILRLLRRLMASKQYRLKAGSSALARRLLEKNFQVRLAARVHAIDFLRNGQLSLRDAKTGNCEVFDHVVLAVQADQVPKLLGTGYNYDAGLFETFSYVPNTIVVHTDSGSMPRTKRDWAQVNYFLPPGFSGLGTVPTTLWLNTFPSYRKNLKTQTFQSFNPITPPREDTIVTSSTLNRAIMTPSSAVATQKIRALQGEKNIWFCGSYVEVGATLQEEGFVSAMHVAKRLGVDLPRLSD